MYAWFKYLSRNVLSAVALTEQKMTFPGQMFATTPVTQMKKTPTTICRTYRRTSFFRRRFLRFSTIKFTFITFACKNQYFVVDWSRRVFTGEKVNWPAAYSWITLYSRYMAKMSAAAYLRMRLISSVATLLRRKTTEFTLKKTHKIIKKPRHTKC